jgi:hypothetical protein
VPPALVQKKGAQSGASVASLSVTLDAPPTPGNFLVACCNSDATVATPAGFSLAVSAVSSQGLYIFYRVVQVGDGAAMAFPSRGVAPVSGDWKTAAWETDSTTTPATYYARLLVGPGGTAYQAGTYDVYVKVTDNPEIPVLLAGELVFF